MLKLLYVVFFALSLFAFAAHDSVVLGAPLLFFGIVFLLIDLDPDKGNGDELVIIKRPSPNSGCALVLLATLTAAAAGACAVNAPASEDHRITTTCSYLVMHDVATDTENALRFIDVDGSSGIGEYELRDALSLCRRLSLGRATSDDIIRIHLHREATHARRSKAN